MLLCILFCSYDSNIEGSFSLAFKTDQLQVSNYMDNEETVNLPRESKRQKLHDDSIADSSASTPPPPPLIPMRTPKSKKAKSKSGQSFSRQSAAAAKKSDK
uniref:Uncharacterized protein n=1 Tax=Octopus bimaculoides TaxID=37653 RepID=A0A0L8HQE8_OCTBM